MRLINKRTLLGINRLVVDRTGGTHAGVNNVRGGSSLGFVDRIVNNEVFGQPIYPDLYHRAAAYLFHIVKDHVFIDGNKRTGLAAAITLLELNGVHFAPFDDDDVYRRIDDLAGGPNDPDTVIPPLAGWLLEASSGRADPGTLRRHVLVAREAWRWAEAARAAAEPGSPTHAKATASVQRARALLDRRVDAVADALATLLTRIRNLAPTLTVAGAARAALAADACSQEDADTGDPLVDALTALQAEIEALRP